MLAEHVERPTRVVDINIGSQRLETSVTAGIEEATSTSAPSSTFYFPSCPPVSRYVNMSWEFLQQFMDRQ